MAENWRLKRKGARFSAWRQLQFKLADREHPLLALRVGPIIIVLVWLVKRDA